MGSIHSRVSFTWILKISIAKLRLKFTHLRSQPYLLEDNELTPCGLVMPFGDIGLGQR